MCTFKTSFYTKIVPKTAMKACIDYLNNKKNQNDTADT